MRAAVSHSPLFQSREYLGSPPNDSGDKQSACNAGDLGLIPGSGRSPGRGNGNPLQYSCLENPMDRGAWQVTVHGVIQLDMNMTEVTADMHAFTLA